MHITVEVHSFKSKTTATFGRQSSATNSSPCVVVVVCYRPVVLRRWFGPQLTHERLEISKNSSTLQFEGALKGMINC